MPLHPTPLTSLRVSHHFIPPNLSFPNTSIHPTRPLLVYHSLFPAPTPPSEVETFLREVGVVIPEWRYTMYKTPHYHSTTNEVLYVFSGRAELSFGGSGKSPGRGRGRVGVGVGVGVPVRVSVRAGDLIVIPAGVGHALSDSEGEFRMIGSYPKGAEGWDMCTEEDQGEGGRREERWERIRRGGWFQRDPVYGERGPVLDRWG